MLAAILKVFFFQIIIISVVVFILKKILEKQLVDIAIQKLDTMPLNEFDSDSSKVVVVSYGHLKGSLKNKITQIVTRKINKSASVIVQRDSRLWGGVIIKWNKGTIDLSLISRLKEGGLVK